MRTEARASPGRARRPRPDSPGQRHHVQVGSVCQCQHITRTVQKDGEHSGESGRAPDAPRLSGGGRRRGGPQCSRLVAKCGVRAASHPPPRGPGGPALGTSPQPGWTGHGELPRTSQMAHTPRSLQRWEGAANNCRW